MTEINIEMPEITSDIMPDVQEHVISSHTTDTALMDIDGSVFDASIHMTRNGEPVYTSRGAFRKKKKSTKNESEINIPDEQKTEQKIYNSECIAAAKLSTQLLQIVGLTIGGEEWKYIKNKELGLDEELLLEKAFTDYYEAVGIIQLSPAWGLCFALSGYAIPRLSLPKTQNRLITFFNYIKFKLHDKFFKKSK